MFRRLQSMMALLSFLGTLGMGGCLGMTAGCKFSSQHNTEREVSWGMSVKVSHQFISYW